MDKPWLQEVHRPQTLAICFSSGDLGDVGRHAVLAALELPPSVVARIRVFGSNVQQALFHDKWKCACPSHDIHDDNHRLDLIDHVDLTTDPVDLHGVDAVLLCLGNRIPFHDDNIAYAATERIVLQQQVPRICLLTSVGLGDDWPPLPWDRSHSQILQALFRTVCWTQFQDLSGAELVLRQQQNDFLVVRAVALDEERVPSGQWTVQTTKSEEPPASQLAHMDCARFLVQEAVKGSLSRTAVVLGGQR